MKAQNGSRPNGVLGSVTEFGNDVATLAELQLKLAELDAKQAVERALVPAAVAVGGVAVILGSLPVILLGVAALVASALQIKDGWAMVLVGGAALVGAAVAAAVAGARVGKSLDSFRRSRDELVRNVAWIRTVLVHSGRTVSQRN